MDEEIRELYDERKKLKILMKKIAERIEEIDELLEVYEEADDEE